MTTHVPDVIYIDARALQDERFRLRGVGQHSIALIEALRRHSWPDRRPRLVAVTDVAQPLLNEEHQPLFDRITTVPRPDRLGSGAAAPSRYWFLNLSPMTHDPVWAARFLEDGSIYRIALFHDLIPLEMPDRYLVEAGTRADYLVALAWLRCYDVFAANSRYTGDQLIARMRIDPERVFVSGIGVRSTLQLANDAAPPPHEARQYVLVSGGGDERKNVECGLVAHASSDKLRKTGIGLIVFGGLPDAMRSKFRSLHADWGGVAQRLSFTSNMTDAELQRVYAHALVTVVPSRTEGFSIPIIESSAAGTPILASDVGPHPELVRDPSWRFDPNRPEQLQEMLERLVEDPEAWRAQQTKQSVLWSEFSMERVANRFIEGVITREPQRLALPALRRGARPNIAVLTPLPPAQSGVANYSAVTLRSLKQIADIHMFTPSPKAQWEDGWASLSPISAIRDIPTDFDVTISIVGNSDHHVEITDFLLENGGACIAHDSRMSDFYVHCRGMQAAINLAANELARPVTEADIGHWLGNPRDLPTLFLSEIARAAEPLLVHSPITAEQITTLYNADPIILPFAQYRLLPTAELEPEVRLRYREKLDIPHKAYLIATFGGVGLDRGLEDMLWALKMLRNWSLDVRLVFCGQASDTIAAYVRNIAASLGVEDCVTLFDGQVSETRYKDYLLAADAGIQLRKYFLGGLSGALNDCISAALPTVANDHLARAMQAPSYIRRVPDNLSPVLIAEAILDILASGQNTVRPIEEAAAFRASHSPEVYCRRLVEALGFDQLWETGA